MKYKLTTETKVFMGTTLYRIEALVDFSTVKAGDKGGWIEKEENLSQSGNAWVSGDARVSGNAWVSGDAQVYGDAWVYGNAQVRGNAWVTPVHISGLDYIVTITDSHMMIGCELHSHDDWRSFDNRRILEMDGKCAAKFWDAHGTYLLALCDHQKAKASKDA